MDVKLMCLDLPTQAPRAIRNDIFENYLDELGGNLTFYKRVSMPVFPQLSPVMASEDWDAYDAQASRRWAAECTCSACGETWHTGWRKGGAILVADGEDGQIYPCFDDEDSGSIGNVVEATHNDGILCPVCWTQTTLVSSSKCRGQTRRRMFCTIDNVGIYTTIFCWLASRTIDPDGSTWAELHPWQAYVIDEAGALNRFIWNADKGWRYSKSCRDAFWLCYTSGDGAPPYGNMKDGFVSCAVPSLVGCTGEKTGLYDYVTNGGQLPILYMKTWRAKPAIENLMKTNFARCVESLIEWEICQYEISCAALPTIDLTKKRPHAMLHMDKESFRQLNENGAQRWSRECYQAWVEYHTTGGCANAVEFDGYWCRFNHYGVQTVLEIRAMYPEMDFPKIDGYMRKQGLSRTEVRLLADTWKITQRLTGRQTLTNEELWPRDLRVTHDRLMEMELAEKAKGGAGLYKAGFEAILEQYGCLQWNDGDLCVVLPKDNGELIREGAILRHCVGGYGQDHVARKDVIFFIRHYRRPERSYYTLDIDMTGFPKEKQLHGYGNERHGTHKQYTHKIPRKVRNFVDRWKREVLQPWYQEQQREKSEKKGSKTA